MAKSPLSLEQAARITPPMVLTDTEAMIDLDRMRRFRLGRLRAELVRQDCAACVLFSPLSIRYAIGVRTCALYQTHITSGYVFVPAEGPVVYFDSEPGRRTAGQLGTVDELREDAIPLSYFFAGPRRAEWAGRWAVQMTALMDRHGGGSRRLAVEWASSGVTQSLEGLGITVLDGTDVIEPARTIKSPEEVLCMNHAIAVAEAGMARMRDELRPGISEVGLWSLLWQTNIEAGGDWIECRLLTSGDRTNPWLQEASSRLIRAGDLVCLDTDMVGPLGYAADISRAYLCGPGHPTETQRDLYKRAHEEVRHNIALMRPGTGFQDITRRAFVQPERFRAQRYPVLAHGIGMCDEWPAIYYPQDAGAFAYDGELAPGMALCVESYVGEAGGREGVKLEEQVLITEAGCEVLSRFPFEEELLA